MGELQISFDEPATRLFGRTINDNLAKDLDPQFAKLFQELGGNEDLDNAIKREKEITEALSKAKESLTATLTKVDEAHQAWLTAQAHQTATGRTIGDLRSTTEGFSLDESGAAAHFKKAIGDVVEKELAPAVADSIRRAVALINNAS